MKRSVNQWCFPDDVPLKGMFETCQRCGLDGFELNLQPAGGSGLTLSSTLPEAKQIRALAAQFGLELHSLSTGLMWEIPLSAQDVNARLRAEKIVNKQLEFAAELGSDTILVVPGLVTQDVSYADCYKRSQAALSKLSQRAAELGVKIGVENVWNRFLLSPLEMVNFLDEIDSPYVGAYFDVGNVLQFGFPDDWISLLGRRILKVHVKDFLLTVGNIHGFVPLLAGDVNWPVVVEALRKIGYDGYLTAELPPYSKFPNQAVEDAARQLQALMS